MAELEIKDGILIFKKPGGVDEVPINSENGERIINELVEAGKKNREEVIKLIEEEGPIEL